MSPRIAIGLGVAVGFFLLCASGFAVGFSGLGVLGTQSHATDVSTGGIVAGTISLTGVVSSDEAVHITAYASLAVAFLNTVMHAYSSSTPGPLAPPDAPVVKAATQVADLPSDASAALISQTKSRAVEAVAAHQP